MSYKGYTDEDLKMAVRGCVSMAEVLKALGLKTAGGNYAHLRKNIHRLNLNTDHFTGKLWSKEKQLKDWSKYTNTGRLRVHLMKLRGNTCECCKNDTWLDKPIKLELHHMDGDRTNNELNNLQLLCPNCHSYTDTWRKHN